MEPTAAQLVNLNQITLLVIGGVILMVSVFGVLAVLISILNYEETPVRDRLMMLKEKGSFEGARKNIGAFDDLKDTLIRWVGPFSRNLYGTEKNLKQVKTLLTEAGLPDTETHVYHVLAVRVAVGMVLGVVLGVVALIVSMGTIIFVAGGLLAGFVLGSMVPQFLLKNKATRRKVEIRFKMADTLDLMVVCVEAGLGLDSTIQKVAEETERMAPEISHEFKRLNKELNAGLSRIEAFQNMGQRAGVDELRSLCAMIIQADKMGTSIADTLRVYADDMRTKRRQRAEELASKASIKMTFPLVFFIFPPLFIILIGPMAIQSYYQFFPGK